MRLTMGGEPTFVSIDDMDGAEWNIDALGPTKRRLAGELLKRLRDEFAPGGLLHFGKGKWYPGESLPRWALACYWRNDGEPIWDDPDLLADDERRSGHDSGRHAASSRALAERLGVEPEHAAAGLRRRLVLPVARTPAAGQRRSARIASWTIPTSEPNAGARSSSGLGTVVGYALPLRGQTLATRPQWESGPWFFRAGAHVPDSRRLADGFSAAARFASLGSAGRRSRSIVSGRSLGRARSRCRSSTTTAA